ncbi:5-formyltetrahydrofolate cyclo-ligase [Candidatus Peregrinibacteria bacterium RIFCSPLOWO2_02_FULL_48_14]|nr:MAG: 5-formyltetrahydrofolate cyclo-ligase [Candidatus Peregrinibacteria bacterium RIFCSPLOWO2_02_FULL_48_14]
MKQALRQEMREKRKALSPASYAKKSGEIHKQLENLKEWQSARTVLLYVSNEAEVDTHALLHDALEKNRRVFVPKTVGENLVICPLREWEDLKPGNFGILEPCEIVEEAHPESMDLILVPGLAFDRRGHRLGYGKGFYDKLLKNTRGFKVGLAFSEQVVEELPTEAHDVPLDLIITDSALIYP